MTSADTRIQKMYLQVTLGVKEQVLWLYIPMSYALAVKIRYTGQELFEAAFDFAG